ncbi:MAG: molybdopterin-dependent oxidoreductase [Rhodobacter sp.]|nr:molybdopterin-dependent oxidoreductase [Rhodobacter sp.]
MNDVGPQLVRSGLTRRSFLKTATGAIALTVTGLPRTAQAQSSVSGPGYAPIPGVARERIDGFDKVTGAKIYARDYNARDMDGWPGTQWYAMFLRALTTDRVFKGVDLSALPPDLQPRKVILGDQLADGQRSPNLSLGRDCLVDGQLKAAAAASDDDDHDFDRPGAVVFDLVVRPGNQPDFLGQATALLLFDNARTYRAARTHMQFDDAAYQVYGPDVGPNPDEPRLFTPETLYVRAPDDSIAQGYFSYYTAPDFDNYKQDAAKQAEGIEDYLKAHPEFISHDFRCDMRAMDPMFMEPESGLIWYERDSKTMRVLLGTQSPDGDVADIASMYAEKGSRLDVEEVVLTSCFPGGGFGGRDSSPFSLMLALCADFADGNPVKLEYDRFEQFRVGLKRHACDLNGSLVVSPDRQIEAIKMDLTFDGGGRRNLSPYVASLSALCAGGSYVIPRVNIHAKAIHSENISGGSQRGFGGPQAFFATETALDEIAAQQGWDPLDLRMSNLLTRTDSTVVGGPVKQELRLAEMLQRTAEHPLWSDRVAIKDGYAQRGQTYGTGLAMSLQAYGTSSDGMVAAILMDDEGGFTVQSDAVDMGNGSATTLGVVIGNILGANAHTVEMGGYTLFAQTGLKLKDDLSCGEKPTWSNPHWTAKSVGSSSACLTGLHQVHVVQQCALALFAETILPAARLLWGLPDLQPDQTAWDDGHLVTDGMEPLPLRVLASFARDEGFPSGAVAHAYIQARWVSAKFETRSGTHRLELDGLAFYPADGGAAQPVWRSGTIPPPANAWREARYAWAPCVNVVGLTVDRGTGVVRIENVLSVLNAGRIHVPQLVSGQSQGGVAMALGYTLFEDMPPGMAGPADGTWNLNRYHVPRYRDVPLARRYAPGGRSQELIVMPETPGDDGQGRGIAEAVMCSIAPAVSNALRDALGVRYTSLPITPEKILKGLRA